MAISIKTYALLHIANAQRMIYGLYAYSLGRNEMKRFAFIVLMLVAAQASADWQSGYTRRDGTYVQGYERSAPDQYRYNNYGSQSNGGRQRDEYSNYGGATNRSNSSWGSRDNDRDGVPNAWDSKPNSRKNCTGYFC